MLSGMTYPGYWHGRWFHPDLGDAHVSIAHEIADRFRDHRRSGKRMAIMPGDLCLIRKRRGRSNSDEVGVFQRCEDNLVRVDSDGKKWWRMLGLGERTLCYFLTRWCGDMGEATVAPAEDVEFVCGGISRDVLEEITREKDRLYEKLVALHWKPTSVR